MSLLFPLYMAGLAAISLPIVFHLIRRMPSGTTQFSSLMFLRQSPPRLSKHSRLENILLLILRATAITLLAFAFARPFLRATAFFNITSSRGRDIAILVDTSASMRQTGLWEKAVRKVDQLLDDASRNDRFGLYAFDKDLRTLVALHDDDPNRRVDRNGLIRQAIRSVQPSWSRTDLGLALVTLADDLHTEEEERDEASDVAQIVVVSDLQRGSQLTALQAYRWPADVKVAFETLAPDRGGNAHLRMVRQSAEASEDESSSEDSSGDGASGDRRFRVRVGNSESSSVQQFELRWETGGRDDEERPISVHVPPGQSRVVRVPPPRTAGGERLVLRGDGHPFDNTLFVAENEPTDVTIGYWGADTADDPEQLHYYVVRAFPTNDRLKFQVVHDPDDPLAVLRDPPNLLIVARTLQRDEEKPLDEYLRRGGAVLYVVRSAEDHEETGRSLASLLSVDSSIDVQERGEDAEYAMLVNIRFDHPIFAPMSDPRFNDYTKLHFWKHRRIDVPDDDELSVVAGFDDGSPALLHRPRERGNLFVLTSGWHPEDSQLARSSKFVPLLAGILFNYGNLTRGDGHFEVDQSVPVPRDQFVSRWTAVLPDGAEKLLATDATHFDETDRPGIYGIRHGERHRRFDVNLPASESDTDPLSGDLLEQQGVLVGWHLDDDAELDRRRQQRDVELEGQQRVWQWLIALALCVLLVETWLAGKLTMRRNQVEALQQA